MAGTLMVSLDLELFWGMLDVCPLEAYQENVLGGRKAIPELLKLFRKYDIHATWAAVGFLFAENYEDLKLFMPQERPTYENEKLDAYAYLETVGRNEEEAPCFYGASLLREISQYPHQEIGTHTFSHYYCREAGQTAEQFAADLKAAKAIAEAHGYALQSVILPRNQCEEAYTEVIRSLGFTAYRDEENDWIHRRVKNRMLMRGFRLLDAYLPLSGHGCHEPKWEKGLWNFTGSRLYRPILKPLQFLEGLRIHRIKKQMLYAAKHDLIYHLWWHPHNIGTMTEQNLAQLEELFRYFSHLKETYGMQSLNMGEAAQAGQQIRETIHKKYGLQKGPEENP